MGIYPEDDDLQPFLSEVLDETLSARSRLGSLLYLEARETFLSPEQRTTLEEARERICRALAAEVRREEAERERIRAETPVQGTLFPLDETPPVRRTLFPEP